MSVAPLQFLLFVFAGWVNRRQVDILEYMQEENRVPREQLGDRPSWPPMSSKSVALHHAAPRQSA